MRGKNSEANHSCSPVRSPVGSAVGLVGENVVGVIEGIRVGDVVGMPGGRVVGLGDGDCGHVSWHSTEPTVPPSDQWWEGRIALHKPLARLFWQYVDGIQTRRQCIVQLRIFVPVCRKVW